MDINTNSIFIVELDLRPRFRVQMVNDVGLEEAGIDGGGIFREFLCELIKTSFDPNRGFFKYVPICYAIRTFYNSLYSLLISIF